MIRCWPCSITTRKQSAIHDPERANPSQNFCVFPNRAYNHRGAPSGGNLAGKVTLVIFLIRSSFGNDHPAFVNFNRSGQDLTPNPSSRARFA